jgi:invasion protein IalB
VLSTAGNVAAMNGSCASALHCARSRPWLCVLLAMAFTLGPAAANPRNGQTFKNWTARCEQAPGSAIERCFIFQNLVLKESGKRVVNMAVGYLAANGQPAAVITMPLGISLPPGASISVDGAEPRPFAIERCDVNGCVGALALSEELVAQLQRGREARVSFHDSSRRQIAVPVSLLGFTAGFASLDP